MSDLPSAAATDIDNTLQRRQLIELNTEALIDQKVFPASFKKPFETLLKERRDSKISYVEYNSRLIDIHLRGMTGARAKDVSRVSRLVAREYHEYVYAFTKLFLKRLARTHQIVAITGANDHIMRHMAPLWGFEHWYGTVLEVKRGVYTGRELALPVADKAKAFRAHIDAGHATLTDSVAIGDATSDIPMLEMARYPVAFNPDFKLRQRAKERHWPIVTEKGDTIIVWCCGHDRDFRRDDAEAAVSHVIALRDCKCAPHG